MKWILLWQTKHTIDSDWCMVCCFSSVIELCVFEQVAPSDSMQFHELNRCFRFTAFFMVNSIECKTLSHWNTKNEMYAHHSCMCENVWCLLGVFFSKPINITTIFVYAYDILIDVKTLLSTKLFIDFMKKKRKIPAIYFRCDLIIQCLFINSASFCDRKRKREKQFPHYKFEMNSLKANGKTTDAINCKRFFSSLSSSFICSAMLLIIVIGHLCEPSLHHSMTRLLCKL